jgi:hypothetical protein
MTTEMPKNNILTTRASWQQNGLADPSQYGDMVQEKSGS